MTHEPVETVRNRKPSRPGDAVALFLAVEKPKA